MCDMTHSYVGHDSFIHFTSGQLDVKAFGVKAEQDNNPAHVAAVLRVCLALMGTSFVCVCVCVREIEREKEKE